MSKVDVAHFYRKCQFYNYRTGFASQDPLIAKFKEIQKQREKNPPASKLEEKKVL